MEEYLIAWIWSLLIPALLSIACLAYVFKSQCLSPFHKKELFLLFSISIPLTLAFSFWSEQGLHVLPVAAILLAPWCLKRATSVLWIYPCVFATILLSDLFHGQGHPDFPFGIGGAAYLDALFLFPMGFTFLAYLLKKWYVATNQQY